MHLSPRLVKPGINRQVDTALLCRSCSWFGVYRADVTARMRACPVCGRAVLAARDIGEDDWHVLGQGLLDENADRPRAEARKH
jgi:ribosomal protein S27AE